MPRFTPLLAVMAMAGFGLAGCGGKASTDSEPAAKSTSAETSAGVPTVTTQDLVPQGESATQQTTAVAKAPRRCGEVSSADGSSSTPVQIKRQPVTCVEARSLARYFLSGEAPIRDGGTHSESWSVLGDGWRGTMNMGSWVIWNPGSGARVIGTITQP